MATRTDHARRAARRISRRVRARSRLGWRRSEQLTIGLAVGALATAGSVLVGELIRVASRRLRGREAPEGVVRSAEQAWETAASATHETLVHETLVVVREGYESTPRQETILFNVLSGFVFSFSFVRVTTFALRRGWLRHGEVKVGDRHIHHFVPGILLAFGSGGAALVTTSLRREELLAVPFGVGIGLTFDEAALLLDFRDVYWTREGLLSVQLSLGVVAVLGGTIIALRMLRRGEQRVEQRGSAPGADRSSEPGSIAA